MSDSPQPDVSVVIPSYNHAPYIEAAVGSVLDANTNTDTGTNTIQLELVVVDDGSSDDSLQRLEAWRDDRRFKLHVQENQGAHAALNRAISLSRGEVVYILNSDDLFDPRRISAFEQRFAERPELALLTSWLEVIDQQGAALGIKQGHLNMPPWPRPKPGPGLAELGDPKLALLETNYISTTSNVAFRRRIFDRGLRFLPLRYVHDWDFILSCMTDGELEVIEQPLVSYRVHASNTIKEGQRQSEGQMRFEILWVVARHAARLIRAHRQADQDRPANQDQPADQKQDREDLNRRMWNSLPRFGYESILGQLLTLRGDGNEPPASYDALLDEQHPWRRAAIRVLGEG